MRASQSGAAGKISESPLAPKSRHMRSHRTILAAALKAQGHTHKTIAAAMGWKSPATVGHKLRGRNDWETGELAKMAELAGMTVVMLAEQSDDLVLAKRREALEGAAILDEITPDDLEAAMTILRNFRSRQPDR